MVETAIDGKFFRHVLSRHPTGVTAITAMGENNRPVGMIVGTFTSVSLDPPLVGFFPDRRSSSWNMIRQSGYFCANLLASDQAEICRHLSGKLEEKFSSVDYELSAHNLPVLSRSLGNIQCEILTTVDAGDHFLVLGKVMSMEATGRKCDPLLFFQGQYGAFRSLSPN
jgi:3-hydroxy-9,10-secoandrosta-1,3,5(10)-triene-9,17-dione monooxygenase reductase component